MMVGIPGSGKSTYAKKLAELMDVNIISSDDIREELSGDASNQKINKDVFRLVYQRMNKSLRNGKNVLVDSTAISSRARATFIKNAAQFKCLKIAWVVDTDLEECIKRNNNRDRVVPENVIRNMQEWFEEPQLDEGFDIIVKNETALKIFELAESE